jgi:branched-chain amino acid transport system permease protein
MTTVWTGISVGCLYALIALGFQIPLTQTGIFNFAQVITVVGGAYAIWTFSGKLDLPFFVALLLATVAMAVVGALSEIVAIRPLRGSTGHGALVTTIGASVIIQGFILVAYGFNPHGVDFFAHRAVLNWFGGRLEFVDVLLMISAVVATFVISFVCRRTQWGLAGRAATNDPAAAAVRGVHISWLRTSSFAFAGALAGLMAPLTAVKVGVDYTVQPNLLVFGFVALAVGGTGSFVGCLVGGLLIGLSQAFSQRYVGAIYPVMIIFGILLLILLFKPTGILGKRNLRAL